MYKRVRAKITYPAYSEERKAHGAWRIAKKDILSKAFSPFSCFLDSQSSLTNALFLLLILTNWLDCTSSYLSSLIFFLTVNRELGTLNSQAASSFFKKKKRS
jgi:hypothetical protein